MEIQIRDYRGCERADIELAQIGLVAGMNEQGKSSIAEAVRCALIGVAITVNGVAKKDADLLVREGAENGYVALTDGDMTARVDWPKCSVAGDIECTQFAAGIFSLFDLPQKERAKALADYIDAAPSKEDFSAAAVEAGYTEAAIDKIWVSITGPGGWDTTYTKARDYATKTKGQWEEVTREKYGIKKAENWTPAGHPGDVEREALEAAVEAAAKAVLDAAGSQAVSESERNRLTQVIEDAKGAEDVETLEASRRKAEKDLEKARAERQALPAEAGPGTPNQVAPCPECGSVLIVETTFDGPTVLKHYDEKSAEKEGKSKAIRKKRASLDGEIERHKSVLASFSRRKLDAEALIKAGVDAQAAIEEAGDEAADDGATINAIKDEQDAKAALDLFGAKLRADKLHADLVRNDLVLKILAPDGLRQRKLAAALEDINGQLQGISEASGWPAVRLDANLNAHYGTRPLWAASHSGKWRAKTMLQIVMANIDGSKVIVLDDADWLDSRGRNGLFKMLAVSGLKCLVCMTMNKRELVPDLEQAGLGMSYWIEAGKTVPLSSAQP